jgi:hypothetical protein
VLPLLALAVVAAAVASPAPVAPRLEPPSGLRLHADRGAVVDGTLGAVSTRQLADGFWGGPYRTASRETVTVFVSDTYPEDVATGQRWADFVASLVHGSEISNVVLYLAPLRQVQGICGRGALACYGGRLRSIFAPGEDSPDGVTAEAIVAHEYGHHVAANRSNAPWEAVDWGTKRWATHLRVCSRARTHELFPGSEGENYRLNPGEGFAEAYRVLNERRLGRAETEWGVVSQDLYPDDGALARLGEDVVSPWPGNANSKLRGRAGRAYTIETPLDGTLNVAVRGTRSTRLRVSLLAPSGVRAASGTAARGRATTLRATVCGARSYRLRVAGSGTFTATVSKP